MLVLLCIAAGMRLHKLSTVPVGAAGDAAINAIDALDWVDRGVVPYFSEQMGAPEPTLIYLEALAIKLLGSQIVIPRLVTAVVGIITVALVYPTVWWLLDPATVSNNYRRRAAFWATAAAALSMHATHISRLGYRAAILPGAILLTMALAAWAWRKPAYWRWVLAGVALGFTQYIYISGRMVPFVVVCWFIHSFYADHRRFARAWRGWLVMAGVSLLLVLPNLIMFITTPKSFTARLDSAHANTGDLIWRHDLSEFGGIGGLIGQKLWHTVLLAVGNAPDVYAMGQPTLSPLFAIGFLVAVIAMMRNRRSIVYAWPGLSIGFLLIPDLVSGVVAEAHAIRQSGILPALFIFAGLGVASLHDWLRRRFSAPSAKLLFDGSLALAVILPVVWGFNDYFYRQPSALYADPTIGEMAQQNDLDISRRMINQADQAYLLPYTEYTRWNIAWMTTSTFRERLSAIDADGQLRLPNPPDDINVTLMANPYRLRHNGRSTLTDDRLWVLLYEGATWLLPPLLPEQVVSLQAKMAQVEPEVVIDRSGTDIARIYAMKPPDDLFSPRPVVTYPADIVFRRENHAPEIRLIGYGLENTNLTPGSAFYVTAYWQVLRLPTESYAVFAQILDDNKQVAVTTHDLPYNSAYRSSIWRPGEVVATYHALTLPDDLAFGRYGLLLGLYRNLHEEALLSVGMESNDAQNGALFQNLRYPPPMAAAGAPLSSAIGFADVLSIGALEIHAGDVALNSELENPIVPGALMTVDITWDVLASLDKDYSLFLHLTASPDEPPVAQADLPLGAQTLPSGCWREGDRWHNHVELTLPETLPDGVYDLWLGVYYYGDLVRLPVQIDGEAQIDGRLHLTTVVVEN
jgi:hypothetical protein